MNSFHYPDACWVTVALKHTLMSQTGVVNEVIGLQYRLDAFQASDREKKALPVENSLTET